MKPEKMFTCDKCGQSFDRYRYPAHVRWCRRGKGYSCKYCHKPFKTAQGRGRHQACHEGPPVRRRASSHGWSRLEKALAKKAQKLREKGMSYLAVAQKLDLMVSALRKVD